MVKKYRSRLQQAPGSEFHPRDESDKIDCGFLGPSWCNKKVNPETYVPCGSYELLLSNVAHQMKEKLLIQKIFSNFPFSAAQNNKKKQVLREIVNCICYLGCVAN